jgi:hypothetical protein
MGLLMLFESGMNLDGQETGIPRGEANVSNS